VVAALVRGDRELNEERLRMALNCAVLEMADAPTVERVTNAPVGFAGPVGLNVPLLADPEVAAMADFVVGANEADTHFLHTHVGRDFAITRVVPLRFAVAGDGCPRCEGTLDAVRGLEVGHVCKVGTREVGAVPGARPLGAMFSDETGQRRPALKGGGGLDLSRLLAAVAERHHDEKGLRWPRAIAPFDVHLLLLDERKTVGAGLRASPSQAAEPGENVGAGLRASPSPTAEPGENVGAGLRASPLQAAEQLCAAFEQQGLEVLFDDRAERPGTKFHDADLIGLPVQVVVGRKWEQSGVVEVRARGTAAAEVLLAEVVRVVGELL
jgi:prolyl-tRNA synthetase